MGVCLTCKGWRVIHRDTNGRRAALKAGECEADAHTEECPACDGLGVDGEELETE